MGLLPSSSRPIIPSPPATIRLYTWHEFAPYVPPIRMRSDIGAGAFRHPGNFHIIPPPSDVNMENPRENGFRQNGKMVCSK